jgi:hypothetical protein
MGYLHDTQMSMNTPLSVVTATVGTWAMTVASNLWTLNKTAADNTSVLRIPLLLPGNKASVMKGAYLKSVDLWWSNATADNDAVSAAIYKATLPDQAGTHATASQSFDYDSGHDTAAKRLTQAVHRMTLTLQTPIWVDNTADVYVEFTVDAAATSVNKLIGARANYTLRA